MPAADAAGGKLARRGRARGRRTRKVCGEHSPNAPRARTRRPPLCPPSPAETWVSRVVVYKRRGVVHLVVDAQDDTAVQFFRFHRPRARECKVVRTPRVPRWRQRELAAKCDSDDTGVRLAEEGAPQIIGVRDSIQGRRRRAERADSRQVVRQLEHHLEQHVKREGILEAAQAPHNCGDRSLPAPLSLWEPRRPWFCVLCGWCGLLGPNTSLGGRRGRRNSAESTAISAPF